MGGLLHLVQRGEDWAGLQFSQLFQELADTLIAKAKKNCGQKMHTAQTIYLPKKIINKPNNNNNTIIYLTFFNLPRPAATAATAAATATATA